MRKEVVLLLFLSLPVLAGAETDLRPFVPRQTDRTAMWWHSGFPGIVEGAPWRRVIQTGHYWLMMDTDRLALAKLGAVGTPIGEIPGAELTVRLTVDGRPYLCRRGGDWSRFTGPRVIESGRFLQRSDVTDLVFAADDGTMLNVDARFEVAAWADQLALSFHARPGLQPILMGEESFGKVGGGYGLTGNNYFELPGEEHQMPEAFTLSFWTFVPSAFQVDGNAAWLFCQGLHEQREGNLGAILRDDGNLELRWNVGGGLEGAVRYRLERDHALKFNQWNHVAVLYDGQTLGMWVNGSMGVEESVKTPRDPVAAGEPIVFGDRGDHGGNGSYRMRGVYDQIRLFPGMLSKDQLRHLEKDPAQGLLRQPPLKQWTFDSEGQASKGQVAENWSEVKMELDVAHPSGTWREEWVGNAGESTWPFPDWNAISVLVDPVVGLEIPSPKVSVVAQEVATGT
ncbi:MAG: LamG-like jellyroll fold domain-containing protein, partial [Verrucomicrobiota bacterium]